MHRQAVLVLLWLLAGFRSSTPAADGDATFEIRADVLEDKIRGGLLGQLFGNLNGLPYEFRFNEEPGNVEEYVPGLPDGARTDDDTDIEWVYVAAMEERGELLLDYPLVAELWRRHINRAIWVANRYARQLISLGFEPPLTGSPLLNPKSHFNISGQFVCETFGLIAPGMPRAAARVGLHYTRVTIDGEPAQATQLFTSMIATAFLTGDIEKILDAGVQSVDPRSRVREIVESVRSWHRELPDDWRATRRRIQERYFALPGAGNGYGVCTAGVVAALLYGGGDFAETLRHAFNFGWDADNTAATAGTILGVVKGRRWMEAQGWVVKDVYRNVTRDGMPENETLTKFGDRLIALARLAIAERGGGGIERDGVAYEKIVLEEPGPIERIAESEARLRRFARELSQRAAADLESGEPARLARAAYIGLVLDRAGELQASDPARWKEARAALEGAIDAGGLDEIRKHLSSLRRRPDRDRPGPPRVLYSRCYSQEDRTDNTACLAPAVGGGCYVAGVSSRRVGEREFEFQPWIWRLDGRGDRLWSKMLEIPRAKGEKPAVWSRCLSPGEGRVILLQESLPETGVWLIAFDGDGDVSALQRLALQRTWREVRGIRRVPGGYLVFGAAFTDSDDAFVLKIDRAGKVLWAQTYDRGQKEDAMSLDASADGSFVLAANSGEYNKFGGGPSRVWVVACDASGAALREATFGGRHPSIARSRDGACALVLNKGDFPNARVEAMGLDEKLEKTWGPHVLYEGVGLGWYRVALNSRGDSIIAGATSASLRVWSFGPSGQRRWDLPVETPIPAMSVSTLLVRGTDYVLAGAGTSAAMTKPVAPVARDPGAHRDRLDIAVVRVREGE